MLKKTMTYVDYNGEEITDDFYFNLTKAELVEMQFEEAGGLEAIITKITNTKDSVKIMKFFRELILRAYGEKSADGKRFMKSPEISKAFSETEAYSDLMMGFYTNAETAIDFFNAIVPQIETNVTSIK